MTKLVIKAIQTATIEAKKRKLKLISASVHECYGNFNKTPSALIFIEFENTEGKCFNIYVDAYTKPENVNKVFAKCRNWQNDKGEEIK